MIEWKRDLLKICSRFKIEASISESGCEFTCPFDIGEETRIELVGKIPNTMDYTFKISSKESTRFKIKFLSSVHGVKVSWVGGNRNPVLAVKGNGSFDKDTFLSDANKVMIDDGYYEGWTFRGDGWVEVVGGHNVDRQKITSSEVTDFRIGLSQCGNTLDELLSLM